MKTEEGCANFKKRLICQLEDARKQRGLFYEDLRVLMGCTWQELDALLDPKRYDVSLELVIRAAFAVSKTACITLKDEFNYEEQVKLVNAFRRDK